MSVVHTSSAAALAPEGARRLARAEALVGFGLIGPAFIALALLFFVPLVAVFVVSATDWELGLKTINFVGLDNFIDLLADRNFRGSLVTTAVFALLVVPATVVLGLVVAVLIESGKSFQRFYRAVHFLPYMATLTAMSLVWDSLLHPTIGLVNQTFSAVGLPTAFWLRDPATALATLAVINVWQMLGFAMILFIAGLKNIPSELYDAADVDGADGWLDRFFTVTLPLLGPVIMFVVIITTIRALETFDTIKILTNGGPERTTEVLLFRLYTESFVYLRTGYGAAIAVIFFVLIMVLTLIQARSIDRRVHY